MEKNIKDQKIVVWFSCGAASAVAAKRTVEIYGADNDVRIVNTYIKQEDIDNLRFFKDVEKWIGHPIESAGNRLFPKGDCEEVWRKRKYMSGTKGAPCTKVLKKEARYQWEEENKPDWHVMGFTADEEKRHKIFVISELPNLIPVLINDKLTKEDCFKILIDAGIELPYSYKLGYVNANCIGCVKATSPTYWNHVRKTHPNVFSERAALSKEIGCRLVRYKGKRIFLDDLPPDAKGRPMKKLKNVECGIFCELPIPV